MTRILNAAIGLATILCTSMFLTFAAPASADQGKAKGHAKHAEKREQKENKSASKTKGSTDELGRRFQGFDRDNDGIITRAEWRGNDTSFANHDWNRDGVLSGNEMVPGAVRPVLRRSDSSRSPARRSQPGARTTATGSGSGTDPDGPVFARLDTNHDGVLTRPEWPDARFSQVDFNRDGVLSPYEYRVGR